MLWGCCVMFSPNGCGQVRWRGRNVCSMRRIRFALQYGFAQRSAEAECAEFLSNRGVIKSPWSEFLCVVQEMLLRMWRSLFLFRLREFGLAWAPRLSDVAYVRHWLRRPPLCIVQCGCAETSPQRSGSVGRYPPTASEGRFCWL